MIVLFGCARSLTTERAGWRGRDSVESSATTLESAITEEASPVTRTPLHRRQIDVQGYLRSDGLWEVEGTLLDTKGYEANLPDRGCLIIGDALHDMTLTLVVDDRLVIREVRAAMRATPYQDCHGAAPRYDLLVGMKIRSGWINDVKDTLGRQHTCTHLTELLPVLATAAFQTLQGYRLEFQTGFADSPANRKRMANTCYGYRDGGRADTLVWNTATD